MNGFHRSTYSIISSGLVWHWRYLFIIILDNSSSTCVRTREVILRNVATASGKALRLSEKPFMFEDVKVDTN